MLGSAIICTRQRCVCGGQSDLFVYHKKINKTYTNVHSWPPSFFLFFFLRNDWGTILWGLCVCDQLYLSNYKLYWSRIDRGSCRVFEGFLYMTKFLSPTSYRPGTPLSATSQPPPRVDLALGSEPITLSCIAPLHFVGSGHSLAMQVIGKI